jgi:PAS domain S-box-containing protein
VAVPLNKGASQKASVMRTAASSKETVVNFPVPNTERALTGEFSDQAAPRAGSDDGPINILIVDDEPKNLTVLETVLDNPAYRLVKAGSADQALLALLADQFALLILDIRMPSVTGIELARMIKERKKTAQIPIIFLTAYYNEDQHVMEGYGAGAVDYLHKPINPDILRSKVAVFAELYRMQREIGESNQALVAEVTERRRVQEQLRELNKTLEHRVIERTRALRASAALLQTATDSASVGLAAFDGDLHYTYANPAYCKIFGVSGDILGKHPSKILAAGYGEQIGPLLNRALAGERVSAELSRPAMTAEAKPCHYLTVFEPERDADGQVGGAVTAVFDITDRKQAEEQIRLLLREVNHRSKNLLSVVSAIARQTNASTQEEFAKRFSDRIQALARSHDLLAKSEWQSISVLELIRAQLAHFEDLIGRRILLEGPSLMLSVAGAQCLGMVMHELATNAAKHGALSNQKGVVEITWERAVEQGRFAISWIERGGPPVVPPTHSGYGSTVITRMAELNLDGAVDLDFASSGLVWNLSCPVAKVLEGA